MPTEDAPVAETPEEQPLTPAALAAELRSLQQQAPARPQPLPTSAALLGRALSTRRITTRKVTEGRWVFEFAGTVIGGYSTIRRPGQEEDSQGGVTTLVPAHARRVLDDPTAAWAHLDLMEIPHANAGASAEDPAQPMLPFEVNPGKGPAGELKLQAYCVGKETISVLAVLPEGERAVIADVTAHATEDLKDLAVDAMRAIPGLMAAGVNIQARALDTADGAFVVGIDETASIRLHHYPPLGPGQPVAEALAEQILFTAAL